MEDSLDDELAAKIMQPGKNPGQMWDYVLARMLKKLLPETPKSGAFGFPVNQDVVFKVAIEYLHASDEDVQKVTDALKGFATGGTGAPKPAADKARPAAATPKPKPAAKPEVHQKPSSGGEKAPLKQPVADKSGQLTLADMLGG